MAIKQKLLLTFAIFAAALISPKTEAREPSIPRNAFTSAHVASLRFGNDVGSLQFQNARGQNLSVVIYGSSRKGSGAQPLVIVPGVTESAVRQGLLAEMMLEQGYGPIYVLEHINQGSSDRNVENKQSLVHTENFEDYVDDLIQFMDGPLKADLAAREITTKPNMIAHSMGGGVTNLALLRRPDLADRVAYVAPMFQIRLQGLGKVLGEKKLSVLLEILCFRGCGTFLKGTTYKRTGKAAKKVDTSRWYTEMENVRGIGADQMTAGWIRAALGATREIRERASEYNTPSLIFMASEDKIIDNAVFEPYACRSGTCTLVEMEGAHLLHLNPSAEARESLAQQIGEFFRADSVGTGASATCVTAFRPTMN